MRVATCVFSPFFSLLSSIMKCLLSTLYVEMSYMANGQLHLDDGFVFYSFFFSCMESCVVYCTEPSFIFKSRMAIPFTCTFRRCVISSAVAGEKKHEQRDTYEIFTRHSKFISILFRWVIQEPGAFKGLVPGKKFRVSCYPPLPQHSCTKIINVQILTVYTSRRRHICVDILE